MSELTTITAQHISPTTWRLICTDTADVYYWWVDGVYLSSTVIGERTIEVSPGQSLSVAIFDSSTDTPDAGYPSTMVLEFDAVTGADRYKIDEWVTDEFVTRAYMKETNLGHYRFQTPVLTDGVEAIWRVTALSGADILGRPREFRALIVRIPSAPAVTYTYDPDTELVTVDEA